MTSEPNRILPRGWWHERDLLVIYGDDPGPAVQALRASGQRRMVCVMPGADPRQLELPELERLEDVVAVRSHNELMHHVQTLPGALPALIHLYVLPGTPIATETRRAIGDILAKAVKSWYVNRTTLDQFGELWMKQTAENLGRVAAHVPVSCLRDRFGDRPVVIVSPGPSLEKNVAQVRELAGRAVIMTCPHALAALEAVGVVPDVVVVGDAKTLAWQYGDYDFSRVPALVLMAPADPSLYALPAQNIFTYSFNPDVDGWAFDALGVRAFLATGGSVACTELVLAVTMGAPEVYFIGQDLAFDGERYYASTVRDGATKARVEDGRFVLERNLPVDEFNHNQEPVWKTLPQQALEVPGWHGGTVQTSHIFTIFLDWFSVMLRAEFCKARVFNCTEGGAYIEGMLHVPFAQAARRVRAEKADIGALLGACAAEWDREASRQRMHATVAHYQERLARTARCAERCLSLAKRARTDSGALQPLERAEAELRRVAGEVPFLALAAQAEIRAATLAGAEAKSLDGNIEAACRLFRVVLRASRELRPLLEEARIQLSAAPAA